MDFYNKDGEPIDLMTWAVLFGDLSYKRIARTQVMSAADPTAVYDVSTVWLGDDLSFTRIGPPIIFETMVFGEGMANLMMDRYADEAAARQGHEDMVTVVAATLADPVLMDAVDTEWDKLVARDNKEQQP